MAQSTGTLFIVATPIGNLQDITLRAIETLKSVDVIVCEDTRITGRLLGKYEIQKKLLALNEFNEEQIVHKIIGLLDYQNVALVSDAGTPLISDPGYRLVHEARKKGLTVIPIPGPNAAIAALSASSLPTDKFVFLGFLPKSKTKAMELIKTTSAINATIVLYESPHRIVQTLTSIQNVLGDIEVTIARELTKIYEEIITLKVSELINMYTLKEPKGEIVVLFSNKKSTP